MGQDGGMTDRDRMERTAVHYAAADGDAQGMKVLLAGGADPEVADAAGWTPLHFAAQAQASPAIEVLLASVLPTPARRRRWSLG
ncbi:ankyrin repeat domain-containing protein [Streptomyces sp. NPDC056470]|uniref:ankyrin repeat domain-containing protein n=1 Tax=unclassified Streptomyces TaxID=2593676 RepID=UPI0036B5EE3E